MYVLWKVMVGLLKYSNASTVLFNMTNKDFIYFM
jgi:hypothetical protein